MELQSLIINRRERCDEVFEYFDGIVVARELAGNRRYKLICAHNTVNEPCSRVMYNMFAITFSGWDNNLVFRSCLDRYELKVSIKVKLSDSNTRNKFKGIFKQYGYDYDCKPYATSLTYRIRFKDDFKLEELTFICRFFLQYMK
ncbi:MAG: hypothetical protein K0R18_87 [Bacillales bacterium]|jgi:hypothetical protein|nr:hypothetical protein [Bacillales bacterium]